MSAPTVARMQPISIPVVQVPNGPTYYMTPEHHRALSDAIKLLNETVARINAAAIP